MKNAIRLASLSAGAFVMCLAISANAAEEATETPAEAAPVEAAPVEAAPAEAAPVAGLESELSRESYAVGANVGRSIAEPGIEIDLDAFLEGFKAAYGKQELAMTPEEIQTAMMSLQQKAMAAAEKKQAVVSKEMEAAGAEAKAEGEAFLAENAKKEGIKITESGLQYKILTEGDGPLPTATDTVKVHYTGTFIDGEKFDSSVDRGEPATFGVDQVIPGWTEALQLMKVGSKWQLAIPSDLAYGPQGRGPSMPPNSVLLFDVELIEIVK